METNKRLASLDILRGFDMWLLLMFGPIVHKFLSINQSPSFDWLRDQVTHVQWEGFVLWDIIMPLFMFMSGVTIPFSMAKVKEQGPDKKFWLKLAKRMALLFFIGWIVQGNLLKLDFNLFHPFANTLQAIAVGYFFAALIYIFLDTKWQIAATAFPFVIFIAAFALTGMNLDPQNNIAMAVDKAILGAHRDGVTWEGGSWSWADWYQYTWILSSLNFIVTVMLGCFSGQIIRGFKEHRNTAATSKRALQLAVFGAVLIISALALSLYFPIIKKIWSSSMTLYAGGISCLMLAFTYYIVDVKQWSKGINWLKYFGMNAIFAYTVGEVINFSSASNSVLHGAASLCGEYGPLLITTANVFILFFILRHLYNKKVFIRV